MTEEIPRSDVPVEDAHAGSSLSIALRIGVVVCVVIAVATAAVKLPSALGIFDLRADNNAALTYSQRAHTHPEWFAAAGNLLEDARLWMPEDARYRVVFGPRFDRTRSSDFTHLLLYGFLLPRRPTSSEDAKWVFCYGCTDTTLGDGFQVLARLEGGPMFGVLP